MKIKGVNIMTTDPIQLLIGIGQILAVAIIPIIIWSGGIKYQNRKAKRDAQLHLFLKLMANRKATPITKGMGGCVEYY